MAELLKVGEWCVDPKLDEITRDGTVVKIEPRAMRLLLCLAAHAGEVVSIERLLDTVWKDVVVTPDSVYQAVAGLRRALGDETKEPAYIATVSRRGYRLVAPVSAPEAAPPPPARPNFWIAALVAMGVLLACGYWFIHPHDPQISVAVLPFVDLSGTRDQEYFADGLTEELIDRLALAPRLHVAARSSSFYFKGRQATAAEVARILNVAYLLEGSVRKDGPTLRVSTHLVRAADGYDLWSQTYDRAAADLLEIQDDIAGAVVHEFKMSLLVPTSFTSSTEARAEYLQAEAHINRGTASDYDAAEMHLHAALLLDPNFSEAWAWRSMATIWKFDVRAASPTRRDCDNAQSWASRALEINPALALAHRAKGMALRSCSDDLAGAETEFNRALELQPEQTQVLMSQAWLAVDMKHFDRALAFASRATAADPLNPWTFSTLCGVNLDVGHAEEAEDACRKAVTIDPSAAFIHTHLAVALLTNHKAGEAVEELGREPDAQFQLMLLPIALDAAGRTDEAERQLQALKLRYGEQNGDWIALFYACRHDTADAIVWLQTYAASHSEIRPYPPRLRECLGNLELDNRYQALRHKLKVATHSE